MRAQARTLKAVLLQERAINADRALAGAGFGVALLIIAFGCIGLLENDVDDYTPAALLLLMATMGGLLLRVRQRTGRWHKGILLPIALSAVSVGIWLALPEYFYGHEINGIVHRSLADAILLMTAGVAGASVCLYLALGATPSSEDVSRYPLILLPVVLALVAYALILIRLVDEGAPHLDWHVLTTSYSENLDSGTFVEQAGMRNHILGTLFLVFLTALIALPVGVGAGVFISEYPGPLARLISFCTSMLRAISVFILGTAAFSVVDFASDYPTGNAISDLARGYYHDANGFQHLAHGTYLLASVFLSLLVIPVIGRATEDGLRSVPREIREGSLALGATEGHGLTRILVPWTLPNIITGLLVGCAEAAGSVAVILFISGTGQYGIGPLKEPTSLAFLIFDVRYGLPAFQNTMLPYQFTAALLLIGITLTFIIAALILRQRFGRRYRGSLSY